MDQKQTWIYLQPRIYKGAVFGYTTVLIHIVRRVFRLRQKLVLACQAAHLRNFWLFDSFCKFWVTSLRLFTLNFWNSCSCDYYCITQFSFTGDCLKFLYLFLFCEISRRSYCSNLSTVLFSKLQEHLELEHYLCVRFVICIYCKNFQYTLR